MNIEADSDRDWREVIPADAICLISIYISFFRSPIPPSFTAIEVFSECYFVRSDVTSDKWNNEIGSDSRERRMSAKMQTTEQTDSGTDKYIDSGTDKDTDSGTDKDTDKWI